MFLHCMNSSIPSRFLRHLPSIDALITLCRQDNAKLRSAEQRRDGSCIATVKLMPHSVRSLQCPATNPAISM